MQHIQTIAELRQATKVWRQTNKRIGFVPTMGALHRGHLYLVAEAKKICDHVVVSIFVNPTQFAPHEDYGSYPRDVAADTAKLNEQGIADILYAPTSEEMYAPGFATSVQVANLSQYLDGVFRPTHFAGVALVVTKLLNQVQPTHAFFGEKDYQQLAILQRLAKDLDLPVEIIGMPTVREGDGLALSSRNAYLTAEERAIAPQLHKELSQIAATLKPGEQTQTACTQASERLLTAGFSQIDYLAVHHAETLEPQTIYQPPARIFAAAKLGKARLIDNLAVE